MVNGGPVRLLSRDLQSARVEVFRKGRYIARVVRTLVYETVIIIIRVTLANVRGMVLKTSIECEGIGRPADGRTHGRWARTTTPAPRSTVVRVDFNNNER